MQATAAAAVAAVVRRRGMRDDIEIGPGEAPDAPPPAPRENVFEDWRFVLAGIIAALVVVIGLMGEFLTMTWGYDPNHPFASMMKIANGLLLSGVIFGLAGMLIGGVLSVVPPQAMAPNEAPARRIIRLAIIPIILLAVGIFDLMAAVHLWLWALQHKDIFIAVVVTTAVSILLLLFALCKVIPFATTTIP